MKKTKLITSVILTSLLATTAVLAWTNLPTVGNGDDLTHTIWNNVVGKINENGSKLDGISNVGGNIGIGELNPTTQLVITDSQDVGISIKTKTEGSRALTTYSLDGNSENQYSQMGFYKNKSDGFLGINSAGYVRSVNTPLIMLTNNNEPVVFGTNNSEKLRISAGGNIGIGVSNPTNKLEVNGTIGFSNIQNGVINSVASTTINIDTDNNATNERLDIAHGKTGSSWSNRVASFYEDGVIEFPQLGGTGNAFLCIDNNGRLFRSATACN